MKSLKLIITFCVAVFSFHVTAAPVLLPLDPSELQKMELEKLPPWPKEMILEGKSEHWEKVLHNGDYVVALYEAAPALLDINYPFPYDEFVYVLGGELILTDTDGNKSTYGVGDMVNIPKGWMGTWHMTSHYRELIIIEAKAWAAAEG